jgi:DNA repair protein SbcC/Rad50
LELELETSAQKLMIAKKALEESDVKLKRMEERKQFIEELKRKEARLQSDIRNIANNLFSKTQEVQDKKTLLGNLQQRQNQFETQIKQCFSKLEQAGLPTNQPIEVMRSALAGFDDKINSLHADQEATSRNMITDRNRAGELSKENKCPLCVQPLEGEYKTNLLSRIEHENCEREKAISKLRIEINNLQKTKTLASEVYSNLQTYLTKVEDCKNRIKEEEENLNTVSADSLEKQRLEGELRLQLDSVLYEIGNFDASELETARNQQKQTQQQFYFLHSELRTKQNRKADLFRRLDEIKERINLAQEKLERMVKIRRTIEMLGAIRDAYRSIQPRLRSEFVKVLRNFVQQVLDGLVGVEASILNVVIDETYTPYVKSESGVDREVSNLSGGERTLLAFAYRLGLGQLIMQSRTGHGLSMLVLDEPTENLGSEDGSIERLAEAISRFKAIEQIIAVTHSEAFADKAEHVITLEKEAGISKISIER